VLTVTLATKGVMWFICAFWKIIKTC